MTDDKRQRKKASLMNHLTAPRPGVVANEVKKPIAVGIEEDKANGLVLSAVQLKEISFFSMNAMNSIFEGLKSREYYEQLKRDIAQDGIVNALIALPDGQLIEGHSRLQVAKELGLPTVPVRFILSTLSQDEIKRRVYLGNLNRFEIPSDMRLILFAEVYPDYFHATPQELDQSHQRQVAGEKEEIIIRPTTAKIVAKAMGLSDRQVRNEKEVFLRAKELSQGATPSAEIVSQARDLLREEKNRRREERQAEVVSPRMWRLFDAKGKELITMHLDAWPSDAPLDQLQEVIHQWTLQYVDAPQRHES
ncbi:ParB/RepB/Spo0J family partition protein (plasmid) [Entomospira nematocerorum]|uniref:ParB N-terminal domain-containing protein n=1 Tax=Entomospira nematocerorum TaxID=2719987 RepID=A0A968GG70_9SPIO|nr:ParB/RepB/Spo0J family partition protein [Entomospira nematocera]NIZ47668.1 ParB N-terminal domain-containing protein [Entomospira nematocera]WDI34560.1 ParB/RepB/Spo0J family partition protein [Entomospira nematocera]